MMYGLQNYLCLNSVEGRRTLSVTHLNDGAGTAAVVNWNCAVRGVLMDVGTSGVISRRRGCMSYAKFTGI